LADCPENGQNRSKNGFVAKTLATYNLPATGFRLGLERTGLQRLISMMKQWPGTELN
jgi:hypothetical protein